MSDSIGGEITLTETSMESADFRGSVGLYPLGSDVGLEAVHGDTITATIIDADDGTGTTDVYVTATAKVDCQVPEIIGIARFDVTSSDAVIGFATDEPTRGTIHFGTSCAALDRSARDFSFATTHKIALRNLTEETKYFYVVQAEDRTGLQTTDSNSGFCRTLPTASPPMFLTELFSSGFDL